MYDILYFIGYDRCKNVRECTLYLLNLNIVIEYVIFLRGNELIFQPVEIL
jgi:hypothetical protein